MRSETVVTALYRTPVKGTEPTSVYRIHFDRGNPQGDHEWMLVDGNGHFLSARSHPRICLIRARTLSDNRLELSAQGVLGRIIYREREQVSVNVQLHDDHFSMIDCGDVAAKWISEFLDTECRLVRRNHTEPRMRTLRTAEPGNRDSEGQVEVSCADGYPVLMISEASIGALSEHMGRDISMLRFRPTIVVSGCEAFEEDYFQDMRFTGGQHPPSHLRGIKRCRRCTVPSVNPLTGEVDEPGIVDALIEMGRLLPEYVDRPGSKKFAMIGTNCLFVPVSDGSGIQLGDKVEVLSRWA